MPRSAAERKRDHRARQACGLGTFHLVLDEVAVAEMLVSGGLLSSFDVENHRAVCAALKAQINVLIELSRRA